MTKEEAESQAESQYVEKQHIGVQREGSQFQYVKKELQPYCVEGCVEEEDDV